MFCEKCGAQNPDGSVFCANCGNAMTNPAPEMDAQAMGQSQMNPNPAAPNGNCNYSYQNLDVELIPYVEGRVENGMDYTPLSMWAYFGYSLLMGIPVAGLVCMIVFAAGGTKKINLRNFARGMLIKIGASYVIGILLYILIIVFAVSLSGSLNNFM